MRLATRSLEQDGKWLRIFTRAVLSTAVGLALRTLAAPRAASGDDAEDAANLKAAMDVLQKTQALYRSLQSYEFNVRIHTVNGEQVSERRYTASGERPGKFRLDDEDPLGELRVSDGHTEYILNRATNKFTKAPRAADAPTPISDLENIAEHVKDAEIMRVDQWVENGKTMRDYHVAVLRDVWPAGTPADIQYVIYSIAEDTFRVEGVGAILKDGTKGTHFDVVKWNEAVPEAQFAFTPPASAHEASSVPQPEVKTHTLIGTEAPDFTLQDASGHAVRLHDLRGKVVGRDFWASWCGPCRAEMPFLQSIHQHLADKGVVVLGLNAGEDTDTATQYFQQGSYTFTILLNCEAEVESKYFVSGLPSVYVIDRQGKIIFHEEGFGNPMPLLNTVVKDAGN